MASTHRPEWKWDDAHQAYYYVTLDGNGNYCYNFSREWARQELQEPQEPRPRFDSGISHQHDPSTSRTESMPEPVPPEVRVTVPDFISGKPEQGWYERLDSSYRMRTGLEAQRFFRKGRVFSMLYSEAASEYMARGDSHDAITVVRFGEKVYSQLKRFIVVQAKKRFVYACGVTTYNERGTLKPGIDPREHAIVYLVGQQPISFHREEGMKDPIAVLPASSDVTISAATRINFGKSYAIEMSVKVKDIGMVYHEDLTKLISFWRECQYHDSDEDSTTPDHGTSFSMSTTVTGGSGNFGSAMDWLQDMQPENELGKVDLPIPTSSDPSQYLSNESLNLMTSRIIGELHSDYEVINNPRAFFKKGRVFMVAWPEPAGEAVKGQSGPPVFLNLRRFVVIRPRATHCVCLPINTYQGQATTKSGVIAQDHAAVVMIGEEPRYHPQEQELTKSPIYLFLENKATGPIDPMSRMNFAKVYTVEYNVKVRNVGRIVSDSIWRMDHYFAESFKLGTS